MYAIWLVPDEKDTVYLKRIIENLSAEFNSPKFVPHITIFGIFDQNIKKIEKEIEKAVKGISPFKIKKSNIGHSDNIWKTLYLEVIMNKEIENIHNRLNHSFKIEEKEKFFPHISLLYKKINEKNRIKIQKQLKVKNEFLIEKIIILKFSNKISEWKIVKSRNL
jgi:2'-5' RNA ligase